MYHYVFHGHEFLVQNVSAVVMIIIRMMVGFWSVYDL